MVSIIGSKSDCDLYQAKVLEIAHLLSLSRGSSKTLGLGLQSLAEHQIFIVGNKQGA